MTEDEILAEFRAADALLEGHFILSSGLRSPKYLQCARVLMDPKRAERFYAAIRRYWPGLADGALAPGYAGIRPKSAGPGAPAPDFEVQGPRAHRVPGLVNLFGIESPGLTASLALAGIVAEELR